MRSDSWKLLNRVESGKLLGQPVLVVRADGKGWFGKVIHVTTDYVELLNGSQKQMIEFLESPAYYQQVKVPEALTLKLAERKLI